MYFYFALKWLQQNDKNKSKTNQLNISTHFLSHMHYDKRFRVCDGRMCRRLNVKLKTELNRRKIQSMHSRSLFALSII